MQCKERRFIKMQRTFKIITRRTVIWMIFLNPRVYFVVFYFRVTMHSHNFHVTFITEKFIETLWNITPKYWMSYHLKYTIYIVYNILCYIDYNYAFNAFCIVTFIFYPLDVRMLPQLIIVLVHMLNERRFMHESHSKSHVQCFVKSLLGF